MLVRTSFALGLEASSSHSVLCMKITAKTLVIQVITEGQVLFHSLTIKIFKTLIKINIS